MNKTLVRAVVLAAALWGPGSAAVAEVTLTFDDAVQGRPYYSYDANSDGSPDVVLSTSDPGGFNTFGPGLDMFYIQEPGIEGTALLAEDLRVNFLRGAVGTVAFGYAVSTLSSGYGVTFRLHDVNGALLGSTASTAVFQSLASGGQSAFPENRVSMSFSGTAAYGTFDFGASSGMPGDDAPNRYIVDNLAFTAAGADTLPGFGGVIASDPILPQAQVPQADGSIRFDFSLVAGVGGAGVDFPVFIDPDVAVGYTYEVTAGPNVAAILVPAPLANGDGTFVLVIEGLGSFELLAGEEFDVLARVSGGISRFRIEGIDVDEALDPSDPEAFVTGLRFVGAGAVAVSQQALVQAVPEPHVWATLLVGGICLGIGIRRRR